MRNGQGLQPLLPARKWRPGGPGRPPCEVAHRSQRDPLCDQDEVPMEYLPPTFGCWVTVYGYFND